MVGRPLRRARKPFDILITATGVLRVPRYPDIPGLDTFAGAEFHSSRWDHSVSLPDKRIGLIGTGFDRRADHRGTRGQRSRTEDLSAHGPVGLSLAESALCATDQGGAAALARPEHGSAIGSGSSCTSTASAAPQSNRAGSAGWSQALCRWNLHLSVRDPELRRKLTPDYQAMCKRQVSRRALLPGDTEAGRRA